MAEKETCSIEVQRDADRKVRKQDYMVIALGIGLMILAKVMA